MLRPNIILTKRDASLYMSSKKYWNDHTSIFTVNGRLDKYKQRTKEQLNQRLNWKWKATQLQSRIKNCDRTTCTLVDHQRKNWTGVLINIRGGYHAELWYAFTAHVAVNRIYTEGLHSSSAQLWQWRAINLRDFPMDQRNDRTSCHDSLRAHQGRLLIHYVVQYSFKSFLQQCSSCNTYVWHWICNPDRRHGTTHAWNVSD